MRVATDKLASPGVTYEPPSPARPWQLIDVLWQPLPPPKNGTYPASPSSPLKRSRTDDESPIRPSPIAGPSNHARRASGSNFLHAHSAVDHVRHREKKRSQSHSTQRPSPTTQDVNAAKALTAMLGSGSGSGSPSRRDSSHYAPGLSHNASLPFPPAFDRRPPRRASSVTPGPRDPAPTDDTDAAELMMFLAHSPSPATKPTSRFDVPQSSGTESPGRSFGKAARVLFADEVGPGVGKVEKHSNLALAPPIGADGSRGEANV